MLNNGNIHETSTILNNAAVSINQNNNLNHNNISNNPNNFINTNDKIYITKPLLSSTSSSSISSPTTSPISLSLSNSHRSSLDMGNNNASINNQVPSFMNPMNSFNNVFNMSSSTAPAASSSSSQIQSPNSAQSNSDVSSISLKRNNSSDIVITSPVNNIIDASPTLHSGNSSTSLFNSSSSFAKDNQKQQVFFQNNVQYNGKICKLDPINSSGYIQLSDEVISVLLNDTRNEGKSFELIKSYLVYFSYSDVEASHFKNMKVGDNVSFKVKMTFMAPNSMSSPVSVSSSSHSPLDMEENSITQAFDIYIKNKNNIPPDVLEMMKMMENIF